MKIVRCFVIVNYRLDPARSFPTRKPIKQKNGGKKYCTVVILIVEKVIRDLDANGHSTIVEIYTDAGTEFMSKEFHEECGKRHIRVFNMPPGEPLST